MEEKKVDEFSQTPEKSKHQETQPNSSEINSKPKSTAEFSKEISKKTEALKNKVRENPWVASTIVLGLLTVFLLFGGSNITGGVITGGAIEGTISADSAGNKLLAFANSQSDAEIELIEINDDGDFYEVILSMNGREQPIHVTKDGRNIVQLIPLVSNDDNPSQSPSTSTDVPTSDNPTAELFVMTHCPFGTQAEKGFIPMMRLMQDILDAKIRFVHYYMHTNNQEEVETPRQVCIREEQPDKYLDYLECFLGGTSGSIAEANACAKEVGIDESALQECIDSGRADEYYAEDSALSEEYGVRGSPTLVVNGVITNSGRDAESYLNTVCTAFNDVPDKCLEELDSTAPSPGFGYSASGSATTASCG